VRESPPEDDEVVPAPEVTNLERTSPAGDVSQVQEGPSDRDSADSDPERTLGHPERSGDWDLLPPPVFEVGRVVFGKYRLLEKIGEGGMGEVWRIWHVDLATERALKLIKPELAHNTKGWKRFQREAQLMAKINHSNAVAVYDFRRAQSVGYIEMEFVRGRSLTEILKENRDQPMSLEQTAQILEQLCSVLHDAHSHVDETTGKPKPIIHRDLKPSNLMIADRKEATGPLRLKVLDFGIAKIAEDEGSPDLTGAGDLVGTPAYMSPEQIRGGFEQDGGHQSIDGRSDLYSTGVVLYHLLTGSIPFRGSKMALLAAHLNSPPMPMKEANPQAEVPSEVERVVMQCLEKDPARRPQTARQLAEQFLQAAGLSETVPRLSSVGGARPRRMIALAAVVVLLAGIGLGAVIVARSGTRSAGPIPEPEPVADPEPTALKPDIPVTSGRTRTIRLWEPEGYAAVDPNDIVPDHPGFPVRLRRLDRETAQFVFQRDYVYLPDGYEPESLSNTEGERWPRVIVRQRDGVRFIRIPAAVYQRGDPGTGSPELDFEHKPITPHYVRVRGFYIQETEVTNSEIEGYVKDHPRDLQVAFKDWKNWYDRFQLTYPELAKDAAHYPAACVDYIAARNYAMSVGGLLPTEAQWEWTAESCTEGFRFAWGEHPTPAGERAWARLYDPDADVTSPAPVKQYPKDQTNRHVFDLVGNMRELCADAYVPYSKLNLAGNLPATPLHDRRDVVDVSSPDIKVVVRGGSFQTPEDRATAYYRWREPPGEIPSDVGFRVVIECPEKDATSP
jgi:serine/threonine protein kinase/formylglycine-generating enzyme required for sulfatase activity